MADETTGIFTMTNLIIGGLVAAGSLYAIHKWIRKTGEKTEDEFRSSIFILASNWLKNELNFTQLEIKQALDDLINKNTDSPIIAGILRIEIEICRADNQSCERKLTILVEKDSQIKVGEIQDKILWEDLPNEIRSEFIRYGKSSLAYKIFERSNKNSDS